MARQPGRRLPDMQLYRVLRPVPRRCRLGSRADLSRPEVTQEPIYTAIVGRTNADLISEVARLYLEPGARVADVTYGKGTFWRKVATDELVFHASDLADGIDFRQLPYADESMDVVVLDPPYMHDPGRPQASSYNHVTNRGRDQDAIMDLYAGGMAEAHRVLAPRGLLWVKCQDAIESGKQRWAHIELRERALGLGFQDQDLFVFLGPATRPQRRQLHAKRNHSYLWVFGKRSR
jgi:hypothetical protein